MKLKYDQARVVRTMCQRGNGARIKLASIAQARIDQRLFISLDAAGDCGHIQARRNNGIKTAGQESYSSKRDNYFSAIGAPLGSRDREIRLAHLFKRGQYDARGRQFNTRSI
jgi:hypothetical protein